ncbi:MAG: HAD hydrolase-like protein [Candidatus Dojkabacteria bacterium]|nr:MAG: HAD hydrolase-like protein [Candidatus Dojkabacteria bacterium]
MKTHFIFDLDDTLTNSYEFNQQMFVETFLPHISDIDEQYVRDVHFRSRGKSMHLQFEEIVSKLNLKLDPEQLVKENEELHIKNVDRIGSFESVEELLKMFKANNKLVSLCTNRQYGSLRRILDNNNLTHYFENIISCLDEGYEKPDPKCLLDIVNKYDLPKDNYLYFGDSKTDHDFAKNAGIDFVIIDQYLNQKKFFKVILQAFF